jgi:alkyl hydroperoxide reductase subunit AhpC
LADYAGFHDQFVASGAEIAALSVDAPSESKVVTDELRLPFPLLCDEDRSVVTAWGMLNRHERGGVAYPALFILGPDLVVRHRVLEGTVKRLWAEEALRRIREPERAAAQADRGARVVFPARDHWLLALRNAWRLRKRGRWREILRRFRQSRGRR